MSSLARIPSGLELTIAAPGFSSSTVSGGDGPSSGGCNRLELDINLPVMPEDDFSISSVDDAEEDDGAAAAGDPRPKKLRLTKEQTRLLEESFRLTHTPNPKQKEALALKLQLRPRQVEVWFQNRRARTKLKQTEVECHYLKRCYNSLTEENRRLQREVEELRALKVAPPTVLSPYTHQPMPASALTMCPRCQQITATDHHWTTPIAPPRLGLRLLGHQL